MNGAAAGAPRRFRWRTWTAMALLGPAAWLVLLGCSQVPAVTDQLYSRGVFRVVQAVLTPAFAWGPVSFAELGILGAGLFIGWWLVRGFRAWRAERRRLGGVCARAALRAAGIAGAAFCAFVLVWGLNHARLPFAAHVDLDIREVEPAVLAEVAERLARRAAARRPDVMPVAPSAWLDAALQAFDAAGERWPVLDGPRPAVRFPAASRLLTLASITGIYSPFTAEPHVNGHMPALEQPFTALHEIAHQRGFAREDEANFIAWWVGSRAADDFVAYSCELTAYRITLVRLARVDWLRAGSVAAGAPPEVRADVEALAAFWRGQESAVQKIVTGAVEVTNDAYLRSAGHSDGVRSYGRMVDLLIAALSSD